MEMGGPYSEKTSKRPSQTSPRLEPYWEENQEADQETPGGRV